jgi:hypothetical protein
LGFQEFLKARAAPADANARAVAIVRIATDEETETLPPQW